MKALFRFLLLGCLCSFAQGQSTTVSMTITNGGQAWANGSVTYVFKPLSSSGSSMWNGAALPANYLTPTTVALDGTGAASFSLPSNTAITPIASQWAFTVCPNATAPCTTLPLTITGSTQSISAALNAAINTLVISPTPLALAYQDSTILTQTRAGALYYNTASNQVRVYDGSAWSAVGGGGGGDVNSVFGRVGTVTAQSGDYSVGLVTGAAPLANPIFTGTLTLPGNATTPSTSGTLIFNTTRGQYEGYAAGSIWVFPWVAVGGFTPGHCVQAVSAYNVGDAGAACGSGGGTNITTAASTTNADFFIVGVASASGSQAAATASGVTYNPSTGLLKSPGGYQAGNPGGGVGSQLYLTQEGTIPSGLATSTQDNCYADGTAHSILCSFNADGPYSLARKIIKGSTTVSGLGAITSGTCATTTSVTATGMLSTDAIIWNSNASLNGVTGFNPSGNGVTVNVWPSANTLNVDVCNWAATSTTPGSFTINYGVNR